MRRSDVLMIAVDANIALVSYGKSKERSGENVKSQDKRRHPQIPFGAVDRATYMSKMFQEQV